MRTIFPSRATTGTPGYGNPGTPGKRNCSSRGAELYTRFSLKNEYIILGNCETLEKKRAIYN